MQFRVRTRYYPRREHVFLFTRQIRDDKSINLIMQMHKFMHRNDHEPIIHIFIIDDGRRDVVSAR